MNAVRNNWKHRAWCRLLQRSHFLMPCKYCITKTPAVSCRLGIPHNSETSTLTRKLEPRSNRKQSLNVTPVDRANVWLISDSAVCPCLFSWENRVELDCAEQPVSRFLCVFSVFFTHGFHKEGEKDVKGVATPAASAGGEKYSRWRPTRSLNKNNLPQRLKIKHFLLLEIKVALLILHINAVLVVTLGATQPVKTQVPQWEMTLRHWETCVKQEESVICSFLYNRNTILIVSLT